MSGAVRREADFLGERLIPATSLYGIHTLRALDNFDVSGRTLADEPAYARALAHVKLAAAEANRDTGALSEDLAEVIVRAARELAAGEHRDELVVDLLEGSGGTSTNMNVNEVIANRALLLLGRECGDYEVLHPNEHVNLSQSTNDVVPTALRLAAHEGVGEVIVALDHLSAALRAKQDEFGHVLRLGRTCLQDAQPMTFGQALGGYATLAERCRDAIARAREDVLEVPLGATAIGTGFGVRPGYRAVVIERLKHATGLDVRAAPDPFDGLQNVDALARLSGELKVAAGGLGKLAGDLTLLTSGPAGGIAEVRLPAVQAGSSIMPGKVNPVIPGLLAQVAFCVSANDVAVASAAEHGQLEINPFLPLIAARLLESARLLARAVDIFATRCASGIVPDAARSLEHLMQSSAIATALVPRFGYARVSAVVHAANQAGVTFATAATEAGLVTHAEAVRLLEVSAHGEPPARAHEPPRA